MGPFSSACPSALSLKSYSLWLRVDGRVGCQEVLFLWQRLQVEGLFWGRWRGNGKYHKKHQPDMGSRSRAVNSATNIQVSELGHAKLEGMLVSLLRRYTALKEVWLWVLGSRLWIKIPLLKLHLFIICGGGERSVVRGKLVVSPKYPSRHQTWWQAPLSDEPSNWSKYIFKSSPF